MKKVKKEINPWSVKRGAEFGMGRKETKTKNRMLYCRKDKHRKDAE